jgi:predicted nucleic acid-binding protein
VIYCLDTSALVKAYVDEPRSGDVQQILQETRAANPATRVFTSRLSHPETVSAIARKAREGHLSLPEAQLLARFVASDFSVEDDRPFQIIEPTAVVTQEAAELILRYPLRGFDAVHLAGALLLHQASSGTCTLVAGDRRLLDAATAEGIPTLDLR